MAKHMKRADTVETKFAKDGGKKRVRILERLPKYCSELLNEENE